MTGDHSCVNEIYESFILFFFSLTQEMQAYKQGIPVTPVSAPKPVAPSPPKKVKPEESEEDDDDEEEEEEESEEEDDE